MVRKTYKLGYLMTAYLISITTLYGRHTSNNRCFTNVNTAFIDIAHKSLLSNRLLKDIKNPQSLIVAGKVFDELGSPVPGVNVVEKGTSNGVSTNSDGEFFIEVKDSKSILVFSFLGYKTQEVSVSENSTSLQIHLEKSIDQLDEIVVVAYGKGARSEVSGAVSKVNSKAINQYSSGSFEQSLGGRMAGVQVTQNGRNPGEDSQITIRGLKTLTAGTSPLIVVDGVPLTEGSPLSSINANDIESVDVLKDAASAAMYGSRASNGVILVTTKKGQPGKLELTYNTYSGFQSRSDKFEMLNAYDAAKFLNKARDNGYVSKDPENRSVSDDNATRIEKGASKRELRLTYTLPYLNGEKGLTDFDWQDAIYRKAFITNHHLALKGGNKTTNFLASFGYLDQTGIVLGTDMKRYTSNFKLNSNPKSWLNIGVNLNTSYSDLNVTGSGGWDKQPVDPGAGLMLMYPFFSAYNEDGSLAIGEQLEANLPEDGALAENQVAKVELSKHTEDRFRSFGSAFLEIEPIKDLRFKTVLGGDYRARFRDYFHPSILGTYRTLPEDNEAGSFQINEHIHNVLSENILSYGKTINGHEFDVLGGLSFQKENFSYTYVSATDIVDDNISNIAGGSSHSINTTRSKWAQMSYFSRAKYNYQKKYFFTAALRRDGSSRFGSNSKWGAFPALSAGWTLSKASFFPENNILTYAKLRTSWGQTGNNEIGNYSSKALVSGDNYTIDGDLVAGANTYTSPNPDISWETNTSTNFGVDLGFLENRLLLTTEYYYSKTSDLLLNVPVPAQSGYTSSLQNIGEIENKGLEIELNGQGFQVGNVELGMNVNFATNKNKVLSLGPDQDRIISSSGGLPFLTEVGSPIAQLYGYEVIGVYKSQEEIDNTPSLKGTMIGDYIVKDTDGDGDVDSDDRIPLGTYNPDFTYGFGLNAKFKNFDFSAQFEGIKGRKVYDYTIMLMEAGEGFISTTPYYNDNYYDPETNPEGTLAAPNLGNFSSARRNTKASSVIVQNGDYFRLRTFQLGYTLPKKIINKVNITNLRVYFSVNNLFTITKYRGINSEGTTNNPLKSGYVRSTAAVPRTFVFGLNMTL